MTYQVTALYANSEECGYGEGDSYEYAAQECADSVPDIYPASDVVMVCTRNVNGCPVTVRTPLDLFRQFCHA
jgi:hypothetical protein